jgi:hypothetical protein
MVAGGGGDMGLMRSERLEILKLTVRVHELRNLGLKTDEIIETFKAFF